MSKSTAKAAPATASTAKVDAKQLAKLTASIGQLVKADEAATVAIAARESTIERLAKEIRDSRLFATKDSASEALKAAFEAAYKAVSRDEKYAGQQRSRVVLLAFADAEKLAEATKDGLSLNEKYQVARNALKKNKKGEWVKVEQTAAGIQGNAKKGSGGHNKKPALEKLSGALALALTDALSAKMTPAIIINTVVTALLDGKVVADELSLIELIRG